MERHERPVGIFGGTFDPIHYGHLRIALETLESLSLAELRLLPARQPPLRDTPGARPEQRLAMLRLAIADQPGFVLDPRELDREGPSYMADTLASLRAERPDTPLCLLVGADAFARLHRWERWRALFDLAHIVVLSRPGDADPLSAPLETEIASRRLDAVTELRGSPAGGIWFQAVTALDISATRIRRLLQAGRSPRYLLPDAVCDYIQRHRLYQDNSDR
ncbi:MAG: nicotinate-nucleotide adenylyltransferase [Candidatus Competibacterales bacterium]|nr:nicotinate-nucleotide adenylyltransferase [Candidatus Competibacterales bacterium]